MNLIKNKLNSLKKLFITNRMTKPSIMGDKLLILATAPCVSNFFEKKSVKEQFKDYDIACINYMLYYSEKEIFEMKPKYFILMDPCLFQEYHVAANEPPIPNYLEIASILERVDWDCYIVTTVFADFKIHNKNIKYIRLSCFSSGYRKWKLPLYKKNIINLGYYNVIQAALFFSIIFGYKDVAMLGCPYRPLKAFMTTEGMHIVEHRHYYDKRAYEYTIPNKDLHSRKKGFWEQSYSRAYLSHKCMWDIKKFADSQQCNIVNYSEDSCIDAFKVGRLFN